MARTAPRVHTTAARIDYLKQLQTQLPAECAVELRLLDGSSLRGTVTERPAIQQYQGPDGEEGTNGQLLLEVDGVSVHTLWLDEIESVVQR